MYKTFTCILYITLFYLCLLAGQTPIDSLESLLSQTEGHEKVQLLNHLYQQSSNTKGVEYAEEALKLSKQLRYNQGIYSSALYLGIYKRDNGNLGKASSNAETALEAARNLGKRQPLLKSLELLTLIYRMQNKTRKLKAAELEYTQLKFTISKEESLTKMKSLQHQLVEKTNQNELVFQENQQLEKDLATTEQDKLAKAAEIAVLAQQKAELQLAIERLAKDSIQQEIDLLRKEQEIKDYDTKLKRQKNLQLLLVISLGVVLLFSLIIAQNLKLKRLRSEEKAKTERQLLMQEKMASLGQLTAGIAHEIKNPLNFVNNFSEGSIELIEELEEVFTEYQEEPDQEKLALCQEISQELKQNAVDVKTNGNRIDRIVKSMMEHANGNPGEFQKIDVNDLVKDNLNLAYHGYRGNHSTFSAALNEEYDTAIPKIKVIPQDLSRALLNIIGNACYALDEKQQKNIPNYVSKIKVSTQKEKDYILIKVWDNGPGIPKDIQQKIFHPFFTTKPTGEGNTGLGLSITNDIIAQVHHGELSVESQPDQFTQFTIKLPLEN